MRMVNAVAGNDSLWFSLHLPLPWPFQLYLNIVLFDPPPHSDVQIRPTPPRSLQANRYFC